MLIKPPADIRPSEITPESVYRSRRRFMRESGTLAAGAATLVGPSAAGLPAEWLAARKVKPGEPIGEQMTSESDATSYNNFYEFGTDKGDPAKYAHELTVDPWTVKVTGEVERPGDIGLEDMLSGIDLEERIYRLRCVEAWSMVIPWIGFPVKKLIDKFQPTSDARYVEFRTLHRPSEMRGQRSIFSNIDWPYVEGLRMDEANHPLAIFAVGMYGKLLPNQNGAPIRLVVPWKYGFKSIKSIVEIRLTRRQPKNTWNVLQPKEYGFYANVNPNVDHPRWSQASERRFPTTLFKPNRIATRMFNGYDEVASLYKGLDLTQFY
ncbi:MAG: protein-methionine-sulfoxide reductase catalytic subunit MsrP [Gammaproteobacteria bacterium]|nr:protein-methionine-sulfoxide reductase catalytic subunit MsrP [Gammaproteobacteria bacterium]